MKKITITFCAMFLFGTAFAQETITNQENSNVTATTSSVDMEELIALSSNRNSRVGGGLLALDYHQSEFGGVELQPLLTGLGFAVTEENGGGDLDVVLASQPWDVAVVQVHSNGLLPAEVTAIGDYIAGGGLLILSYWDLDTDAALQAIVGVTATIDFFDPLPVTVWETADPIFNTPNLITGLAVIGDNGGSDNGDRMEPAATATALAGFTATPTANEGAIIRANGGNSYFHGFAASDLDLATYLDLIENEVTLLVLGVEDNTISGFDFYPNPVRNTLNVSAQNSIDRVEIFNLLGQKVLDVSVNALSSQINLSGLSSGAYVMSVTVNGQVGSYKIMKN